ncbi:translation initiation factor IF3-1, mitochondrial [Mercurialis annua]|uniref:translation initiation factor IF3-1, mitochondrial n=1 Tax=Mercurialis annua TaxID=3986 RepID=UPI00215E3152|nr:translation initiation factor IF3-1, mitochondrial [Mercurialis annua]
MALFWNRVYNRSKFKFLLFQFQPFSSASYLHNYTPYKSSNSILENPNLDVFKNPIFEKPLSYFCNNARAFSTSLQGPRLNEQITSSLIRLVTDEGHDVIPLHKALEQARKLKLDLVEVDKNVSPPVCKIMDFNKKKYERKVKEKDRAKSKSEVMLKKGDCKEVRFSAKTELKDLKIKADAVIRLMQRGYRVKCMALGAPKKGGRALKKSNDDENLTEEEIAEKRRQEEEEELEELKALVSQLTALLENDFIIESGPRAEKKQAYVIVRHAKFGPSKKSGAKKSKDAGKTSGKPTSQPEGEIVSDEDDLPKENHEDNRTAWSVDSTNDFDSVFAFGSDSKQSDRLSLSQKPSPGTNDRYKPQPSLGTDNRYKQQPSPGTDDRYRPQPSLGADNRYKQQPSPGADNRYKPPPSPGTDNRYKLPPSPGADNRYKPQPSPGTYNSYNPQPSPGTYNSYNQQPPPGIDNRYKGSEPRQRFPPITTRDIRAPDQANILRFDPQLSPQSGHSQSQTNITNNQVQTDSSVFRSIPRPEKLKQPNAPSVGNNTPASGFGIFSSSDASSSRKS